MIRPPQKAGIPNRATDIIQNRHPWLVTNESQGNPSARSIRKAQKGGISKKKPGQTTNRSQKKPVEPITSEERQSGLLENLNSEFKSLGNEISLLKRNLAAAQQRVVSEKKRAVGLEEEVDSMRLEEAKTKLDLTQVTAEKGELEHNLAKVEEEKRIHLVALVVAFKLLPTLPDTVKFKRLLEATRERLRNR